MLGIKVLVLSVSRCAFRSYVSSAVVEVEQTRNGDDGRGCIDSVGLSGGGYLRFGLDAQGGGNHRIDSQTTTHSRLHPHTSSDDGIDPFGRGHHFGVLVVGRRH